MTIKIENKGSSTSVLIPSQNPLQYRACLEAEEPELLIWFAKVERHAWEYVHTFFFNNRPDSIFLVLGQTLTDEYSICHLEAGSSSCEVSIEPSVNLGQLVKAHVGLGYGLKKASASIGFRIQRENNENTNILPLSSIYLQIYESFPLRRLQIMMKTTLSDRIERMFKYQHNDEILLII